MKIKDTVYKEMDGSGRVIKHERVIEIDDCDTDRGYDEATRHGQGHIHQSSLDRLFNAINDYRKSQEW